MKFAVRTTLVFALLLCGAARPPLTDRDGSRVFPSGDETGVVDRDTIAAEIEDSGTAWLSSGTYYVSGSIEVNKVPGAVMAGYGATVVQVEELAKTIDLKQCHGAVVRGIHFVGYGQETPWEGEPAYNGVAGVFLRSSRDVLVADCMLSNHAGGGIVLYGACPGVRVCNNRIAGMGPEVIAHHDNGGDGAIRTGATGHHVDGAVISGNVISGHAFGILAPPGNGMVIANNVIRDIPGQHGIYMANGADCTIIGNAVTNCAEHGIKVQHQSASDQHWVVNITGNSVSHVGSEGIVVMPAGAGVGYFTHNVSVTGNNIHHCRNGMRLRYAKDIFVRNNRISGYEEEGIRTREVFGVIENNFIVVGE